jgi:hypothetical protein
VSWGVLQLFLVAEVAEVLLQIENFWNLVVEFAFRLMLSVRCTVSEKLYLPWLFGLLYQVVHADPAVESLIFASLAC